MIFFSLIRTFAAEMNKKQYIFRITWICCLLLMGSRASCHKGSSILLEAESFLFPGGWVLDNQSMDQMGSPYLLAHGMGEPVEDATTRFTVKKDGSYRLWVRTRDWVKRWGAEGSPGRFTIAVNGRHLPVLFGTNTAEWDWQDGGCVELQKGLNTLALHDLTGFDGRCDAIYLTTDTEVAAPSGSLSEMKEWRRKELGIRRRTAGEYDLVVVGGGIAGCCTAVSAARLGLKVALVQNRPVLGGNNSSEVRVGLSGLIYQQPYPELGRLMDELGGVGHWTNYEAQQDTTSARSKRILAELAAHPEKLIHNAGPASNYEDGKKLNLLLAEKNISLFLNTQAVEVQTSHGKIRSVVGKDNLSGEELVFRGTLFADCTGDGTVGYLAGADYRMGREGRSETQESLAPSEADSLTMGASVQWYSEETEQVSSFPECSWALSFADSTCFPLTRGDWDWEAGLNDNQIEDIEYVRDHALRAVYGNWSYLKNHSSRKEEFARRKLRWVAFVAGKRESRRLMGDLILRQQDLEQAIPYEDATFTTTWGMDLHYPKPVPGMEGDPFLSYCKTLEHKPYAVPYRCLYSRNIDNLFMAGRDISATHAALGSIRVMRTGGMMGEVVGMAASLCKKHQALPRQIYEQYLPELKELMRKGVSGSGNEFFSPLDR